MSESSTVELKVSNNGLLLPRAILGRVLKQSAQASTAATSEAKGQQNDSSSQGNNKKPEVFSFANPSRVSLIFFLMTVLCDPALLCRFPQPSPSSPKFSGLVM